jgi:NAD(P)-dependent dehydrogenase (short-subunit alcohol dehydrogenase family)
MPTRKAIIIAISSDIGHALAQKMSTEGWSLWGTYRTASAKTAELAAAGVTLVRCDLAGTSEHLDLAVRQLAASVGSWDALIIAPGAQEPIGLFHETPFADWAAGVHVNFTTQLQLMHGLLPSRNLACPEGVSVMFFAGGGTNNAPIRYSAYTISKVALIKMCELLQAELLEVRFTIVGPGWVKTKIHQPTFESPDKAGDNFVRTHERFAQNNFVPMESVVGCCTWLLDQPKAAIGGRNFSVAGDAWGNDQLITALSADPHMYKLRRHGNAWQYQASASG